MNCNLPLLFSLLLLAAGNSAIANETNKPSEPLAELTFATGFNIFGGTVEKPSEKNLYSRIHSDFISVGGNSDQDAVEAQGTMRGGPFREITSYVARDLLR